MTHEKQTAVMGSYLPFHQLCSEAVFSQSLLNFFSQTEASCRLSTSWKVGEKNIVPAGLPVCSKRNYLLTINAS
jgi:hypothetical protein